MVLNGMLWPTFYVYYVSYADNEQETLIYYHLLGNIFPYFSPQDVI